MTEQHCVIIGASHAGVSLAMQLRREGWEGEISLISSERELPYQRPPLSKEYLAGEKDLDDILLRPEKIFTENSINLRLGLTALQLNTKEKLVKLSDGNTLQYGKLALCVGSIVRAIPFGKALDNVFYIRTANDISRIRPRIKEGKKAVIIGGGYIGLETAAVLCKLGLEVTVIEMAERILQRVTSEKMSNYIQSLHNREGVSFLTSTKIEGIEGKNAAETIICQDGTTLSADLVIVGVGVSPNIGLAEAAGLKVAQGIIVNEYSQTSDVDVFAAGDCTLHPNSTYGRMVRLESVQNANEQARHAAANICGKQKVYHAVPWFWSDQFKAKLQIVGLSQGFEETIVRGDMSLKSDNGFALFYIQRGRVIAADCVNRPKEFLASKRLVKEGLRIPHEVLADQSIDPANLPSFAI